jgi:hypothetical protein
MKKQQTTVKLVVAVLMFVVCAMATSVVPAGAAEAASEPARRNGVPTGWILRGSKPDNYEVGTDTVAQQGKKCVYIISKQGAKNAKGDFVTLMQNFLPDLYRGKRVRLSAYLMTESVEEYCGLWMRIDGSGGGVLQFDNMEKRPVKGTTDWQKYEIVLDVPQESSSISLGVLMSAKGLLWADSFKLEEVGSNVATTNMITDTAETKAPDTPANLDFEE